MLMWEKTLGLNLSVIVPVGTSSHNFKNLKSWLGRAIEIGVEAIIVIDTDDKYTISKLNEVLQDFPQARIVNSNQRNPGGSRNIGLSVASRNWVSFVDADDELVVNNLMNVLQMTIFNNKSIGVGQFYKVEMNSHTNKINENICNLQMKLLEIPKYPGLWRFIFLKSRIKSSRFPDLLMAEDQIFLHRLNMQNNEIYFSDKIIYKYHVGGENQFTTSKLALNHLSDALKIMIDESNSLSKYQSQLLIRLSASSFKYLRKKSFLVVFGFFKHFYRHKLVYTSQFIEIFYQWLRFKIRSSQAVLVVITGGLGNQLFQLAFSVQLSQTQRVYLDTTSGNPRKNTKNEFELNSFTIPLKSRTKLYKPRYLRRKSLSYLLRSSYDPISFEKNSYFRRLMLFLGSVTNSFIEKRYLRLYSPPNLGWVPEALLVQAPSTVYVYFQSYLYSHDEITFDKLMSMNLANPSMSYIKFESLARIEKPLIVHVRLGDYKEELRFGILDKNYYRESISAAFKLRKFDNLWIFSDEPHEALNFIEHDDKIKVRLIKTEDLTVAEAFQVIRHGAG